ncbi:hypothetical protein [Chryseobacterium sp. T20]|uniref:hypothetical protein n=1 Tax=Chryseobacterium sp. T20 TaxID=3395375 RepID=UPI0039BD034F
MFFFIFLLSSCKIFSQQEATVEKSIFNIQLGTVGVWLNNELKISNSLALRAEAGLEPSWFVGNGSVWHPNFRLEPRYYYNLSKRSEKGFNTKNNSGNFLGIAVNYRPGTDVFSSNNKGIESYSIVPKWGIRRSFAKNFNYEAGIGFGFRHETDYGNYGEIDLHLRIGYNF